MKKLRCTKCGQVFWTELQVNEALITSGEWIKSQCPKCRGEWAIVEAISCGFGDVVENMHFEGESTDAGHRGGPTRRSVEVPVMGME